MPQATTSAATTSTTSTGGAAGAGGDAPGGGGGMGGAGGGACSFHENAPAPVSGVAVAEDLPAGNGGKIHEGEYHLVEIRIYTGPGGMTGPMGPTMQESQVWSLTEMRNVVDLFDGQGEQRFELGYDLGDGTGDLAFIGICPGPVSVPYSRYTAEPTTLTLYAPAYKLASVYALQPHQ